jgi:hypothetical protein
MPCKDVTELIRVVLDESDCLKEYVFAKRSCGQGVGAESLLIGQLGGMSLEALLAYTAESFLSEFPIQDELEEFLSLKHLFALQGALEVLTGKEPGRAGDPFAASEIAFDVDETIVAGRIGVDLLVDKIQACGGCASCGSEKAETGRETNRKRRESREAPLATAQA